MDTARIASDGGAELIEAATIVLLRDLGAGVECLMLQKTAGQTFGEHWVFPGGRVEPEDGDGPAGIREAAVREAREETGLVLDPPSLVPFAHWVPPVGALKRFSTWFFLAALPDGADDVVIDGGEIGDQMWTTAAAALERHRRGETQLAPPTWVTLHWLSEAPSVEAALAKAAGGRVEHFATEIVSAGGVLVALWAPDAAYGNGDLALPGPRHRLHMHRSGWEFERK
jgi:8-oxo-dGTP pyrophosphatase MutT (NUDIX family)